MARIVESDVGAVGSSLESCVAFGLLQRFDEADHPSLYHPPGLLRPWLSAPERLAEAESRAVHRTLAAFWRSSFESDRESALRVPVDVELTVCRTHARLGEDTAKFRWATTRLAWFLERRAEWSAARALLSEIAEADHDAESLLALASLEVSLGEWKLARQHLESAQQALPEDSPIAAATWHQLATIDLRERDYPAAHAKFGTALAINQAIGDRAGEAATFSQLGALALKLGLNHQAARLVAIWAQIDRAIGHGDAESDLRAFITICTQLGCDQDRIMTVWSEAGDAYRSDRGQALIERAFAGGWDREPL